MMDNLKPLYIIIKGFLFTYRKEKIIFESNNSINYKNAMDELKNYFKKIYKYEYVKEIDSTFLNN